MDNIFFLIFRRMRLPLITLVLTYAMTMLGLVLIPGQDPQGNPWHMDFFHAFYFVSFMATTIGFGEIPYEFTDAQRLWVTLSIYATVVVWIYAIGTILTLVQDHSLQQAFVERRFSHRIKRMRDPFLLVCGYGETGSALIRAVTERHQHAVAIDIDQDRVNILKLENLREFVPALHADASRPLHLLAAGLEHRFCRAVVALTNDNDVNLKIAITSKLLHPDIRVICRADSHDVEVNMASFGTDFIIDPYDKFAGHLATALHTPGLYLLQEWLTGVRHQALAEPIYPPKQGRWIVCGYGRFGRAVYRRLKEEGLEPVVVEATPEKTGLPQGEYVVGRGTEAETLEEAGIAGAVGLVAGTDKDSNNLSIIMTAKQMKPDLFVVARQNQQENQRIFDAVQADMVMHPSAIIANRIRVLLATPLLYEFASLAMHEEDSWACELISRITALVNTEVPEVPEVWEVTLNGADSYAVYTALTRSQVVTLGNLLSDSREREYKLLAIPLLLLRNDTRFILPADETRMKEGDQLLLCGTLSARYRMEWTLQNDHALSYVLTGEARPQGWFWKLLHRNEWGAAG